MNQITVVIPSRRHTPHLPRTLEMTECGWPILPPVKVNVGATRKPVCVMCKVLRAGRSQRGEWLRLVK